MADAENVMDVAARKNLRWVALESSPEVLNAFSKKMGLPDAFQWNELFGFDDELLGFVPQPVKAVCLLFASTDNSRNAKKEQKEAIDAKGQTISDNLWYTKQVDGIGNACGSIAVLHSMANLGVELADGPLKSFMGKTKDMDADKRGLELLSAADIQKQADNTANDAEINQTDAPGRDDSVNAHFIAFVWKDGCCYECDGRKAYPINHGECAKDKFLNYTCGVIKKEFMAKDPASIQFNACALSGGDP